MTLSRLLRISRPRFWLYEAGTFAVGATAAIARGGGAWGWELIAWFAYFLVPANLLIYGVNDVFDHETDLRNPKKQGYEDVLPREAHRTVLVAAAMGTGVFAPLLLLAPLAALPPFLAFLFCAVQYSAPPIRAKARPFWDSLLSAGHYVATGWFAYALAGGRGEIILPLFAGMSWAVAMHAYSAVPDIAADAASGIRTVANRLGARATIAVCGALYAVAAVAAYRSLGPVALVLCIPYLALMASSYRVADDLAALTARYRLFPLLNALAGAAVWWAIVLVN